MVVPSELRKMAGGMGMKILWSDGHQSQYEARWLRDQCRCAACRHELTGEKLIKIENIPENISILKAGVMGNYALSFTFSDNHGTGIYAFENLRKACPCCRFPE